MRDKFSIPLSSPTYPRPPYRYKDAKLFLALFNPTEETVERVLPEPLRPSQMPLAALMFAEQPCVETGTFMESAVLVQCMFDDPDSGEESVGVYFSHCYADTSIAISSGREIWGYPRKRADIKLEWDGDRLTATTTRDDEILLRATCEFEDDGEWIDSGPNINVKLIPSVTGEGFDLAVVTAADLVYDIKKGRSGEVEVELLGGEWDDFGMYEVETPMIGLYFDCDITVPLGRVIGELRL